MSGAVAPCFLHFGNRWRNVVSFMLWPHFPLASGRERETALQPFDTEMVMN